MLRLLESIRVKLAYEAGERDAFEAGAAGQGVGAGGQDLLLQELLVNFYTFTIAVPNNGCDFWMVYQIPQFCREEVRDEHLCVVGLHFDTAVRTEFWGFKYYCSMAEMFLILVFVIEVRL